MMHDTGRQDVNKRKGLRSQQETKETSEDLEETLV